MGCVAQLEGAGVFDASPSVSVVAGTRAELEELGGRPIKHRAGRASRLGSGLRQGYAGAAVDTGDGPATLTRWGKSDPR